MTAPEFYRLLNGVFAVYKHSHVATQRLGQSVLEKLRKDLCSLEQRPQKQMIQYLPRESSALPMPQNQVFNQSLSVANTSSLMDRVPVNVTDWFDHPLVQGHRYSREDLELYYGHMLDQKASGIQLLGLQSRGRMFLEKLDKFDFPRSYHLHGRFGQASLKFDGEGKVIERSTWDHITETKISRLLSMIQGTYRNALLKSSNIDLDSQHAYRMACKGLLRPTVPTGSMILDLKLKKLNLPDFVIDVTCINESCMYLRKLVHEIGLELRSSAVCLRVTRYRDAIFYAQDESTLLTREVTAQKVADVISEKYENLSKVLRRKPSVFQEFSNPPKKIENFDSDGREESEKAFG